MTSLRIYLHRHGSNLKIINYNLIQVHLKSNVQFDVLHQDHNVIYYNIRVQTRDENITVRLIQNSDTNGTHIIRIIQYCSLTRDVIQYSICIHVEFVTYINLLHII